MNKTEKSAKVSSFTLSNKAYNPYLDVLKGFTILLVVFGHAIQDNMTHFDQNLVFRIIYSFHVPLFMFLAGAVTAYSLRPMNWKFTQRKFYMLVIPFVTWGILDYIIKLAYRRSSFTTYAHQIIVSPDYGLWFLWVLFLNFVALAIIKKLSRWLKFYSYPLVWLAIYAIPTGKYGIGLLKWHLPFFIVGYLVFKHREQLIRYRRPVLFACLLTAPFLVLTWHRLYDPSYISGLQPQLAAHGLQSFSDGDLASINAYAIIVQIYRYLVPFSAIGAVFWLLQFKPTTYLWKWLGFIGLYTLDIYVIVIGSGLQRFGIGGSWLKITSAFVFATSLSLVIGIFILRRIPILSTILLGGRSTPKAFTLKK